MSAPRNTRRARPAAGIFVVDSATGRFALPATPDALPLAFSPVNACAVVHAGERPDIAQRALGVRSLSPRAFTDAALSAAHAQLGLLFASPANAAVTLPPQPGLWGRAARHGLAPDRQGLTYLGRSVFTRPDGTRWHLRLFAIAQARAVQALFPVAPGGRAVWIEEEAVEARLAQPELTGFIPLARAAASGVIITPLQVRKQAGRLRTTGL
ncbi:hypothetical protein AB6B38_05195 [Glycocaulis abyssi]|uniref:Uncharacterized protein n=1 Tax=Glycocaulis abyssi TaxID=1433403 RepID=A0ABV9N701_9PROT